MTHLSPLDACHARGQSAARRRDFAYAHELFTVCVLGAPGDLTYVESLLQNLRARQDHALATSTPSGLGSRAPRPFRKALAAEHWPEVFRLGLQQLGVDPAHVPTLRGLAWACAALHHPEVELAYLKQALDSAPRDVEVNRHCATSLARMGQFDQAIACWHRIEAIRGQDATASAMVLRLTQDKMQQSDHPSPHNSQETGNSAGNVAPSSADKRASLPAPTTPPPATTPVAERSARTPRPNDKCASSPQLTEVSRPTLPWLELGIAAASVALLFQWMPSWWNAIWDHVQVTLIVVNLLGVLLLIVWQVRVARR